MTTPSGPSDPSGGSGPLGPGADSAVAAGTDLFRLDGAVAIVTGASGWLGTAITSALVSAGAHVVAVARDKSRLEALPAAETVSCDVTTADWPLLVRRIADERGRIDVLVNNAHIGRGGSLRQATAADYREALDLAIVAASEGINAARPGFAASVALGGSPSVINVSSMYGVVSPDPGLYSSEEGRNPPYYGVAKAGLLQLTRYAAAELGPSGVRVNAITPGPFPQHPTRMDPAFVSRLASRTVLNRIGTPADIRTAILFLASPHSSFVTGAVIPIDGGWTTT